MASKAKHASKTTPGSPPGRKTFEPCKGSPKTPGAPRKGAGKPRGGAGGGKMLVFSTTFGDAPSSKLLPAVMQVAAQVEKHLHDLVLAAVFHDVWAWRTHATAGDVNDMLSVTELVSKFKKALLADASLRQAVCEQLSAVGVDMSTGIAIFMVAGQGAGKSYVRDAIIQFLTAEGISVGFVSADAAPGLYPGWTWQKAAAAHTWAQNAIAELGTFVIIVDNTHSEVKHMTAYLKKLAEMGITYFGEIPVIPDAEDEKFCAVRNAHGVGFGQCMQVYTKVRAREPHPDSKFTVGVTSSFPADGPGSRKALTEDAMAAEEEFKQVAALIEEIMALTGGKWFMYTALLTDPEEMAAIRAELNDLGIKVRDDLTGEQIPKERPMPGVISPWIAHHGGTDFCSDAAKVSVARLTRFRDFLKSLPGKVKVQVLRVLGLRNCEGKGEFEPVTGDGVDPNGYRQIVFEAGIVPENESGDVETKEDDWELIHITMASDRLAGVTPQKSNAMLTDEFVLEAATAAFKGRVLTLIKGFVMGGKDHTDIVRA